jgi:hypothetical protein
LTPETPSAEKERLKARKVFDEFIELGAVPPRPWVDYQAEDLTDSQRGDDNGEEHIMSLYLKDRWFWRIPLRLWTRFAKRRSQDGESHLGDLDPIDAVAAFTAYLRGHLQRDLEHRVKPGCEIWGGYTHMTWHRDFIEDIVKVLPAAEAQLRQLRIENGDANAVKDPGVTSEGLNKEYKIPHRRVWMEIWEQSQESLSDAKWSHLPKRQRDDGDEDGEEEEEEEEDARPSKRIAPDSKLGKPAEDDDNRDHETQPYDRAKSV